MYAIFIRGRREPVTCDDFLGRTLKDQWVNGTDELVEIEDAVFPTRAITRIESNWVGDVKVREIEDMAQILHKERQSFSIFKAKELAKSTTVRAKNMQVPKFMYYSITGSHIIPEVLREQIEERQAEFFEENSDELYANPRCYKDLMPDVKEAKTEIETRVRENSARLVERLIMGGRS